MLQKDRLKLLLGKLIKDGRHLLDKYHGHIGDKEALRRWSNELILFKSLAGDLINPWSKRLTHDGLVIVRSYVEQPVSALEAIQFAIDEGLLVRYEDLVVADTFADLTEQADYLFAQGYFLASGVIYRAILEERLRKLCDRNACVPSKTRPTINDYNTSLYTMPTPVYDKSMMLHITSLAAIGNDAAHNSAELKKEDVERLGRGVADFLARFST